MRFSDIGSAQAYYASRYAEMQAGRLHPAALDAERRSIEVAEPGGRRLVMDERGQWVALPKPPRSPLLWLLAALVALAVLGSFFYVNGRGGGSSPPVTSGATASTAPGVIGRVQQGGLVLYIRHAERDEIQELVTDPADCSQQANLTDGGRQQAVALGAAIQGLGVRTSDVYASPYCRTRETAALAFGTVTLVDGLAGDSLDPPVPAEVRRETLERLLATVPPEGSNVVIVGHGEVITAVAPVDPPAFAETLVFENGTLIGRITFDDFVAACRAARACA